MSTGRSFTLEGQAPSAGPASAPHGLGFTENATHSGNGGHEQATPGEPQGRAAAPPAASAALAQAKRAATATPCRARRRQGSLARRGETAQRARCPAPEPAPARGTPRNPCKGTLSHCRQDKSPTTTRHIQRMTGTRQTPNNPTATPFDRTMHSSTDCKAKEKTRRPVHGAQS